MKYALEKMKEHHTHFFHELPLLKNVPVMRKRGKILYNPTGHR